MTKFETDYGIYNADLTLVVMEGRDRFNNKFRSYRFATKELASLVLKFAPPTFFQEHGSVSIREIIEA